MPASRVDVLRRHCVRSRPLLYDGGVGYNLSIDPEPEAPAWHVALTVRLSRAEANELFLAGDVMVAWPTEGMMATGEPGLERGSMFVSEMTALPQGLRIEYAERAQAERAVAWIRARLADAGIEEEG